MAYPNTKSMREERRKLAEVRQAEYAALSPQEKLARLDQRLGVGVGAKRERAWLQKQIEEGVTAPKAKK
jgi:hypothetical protein